MRTLAWWRTTLSAQLRAAMKERNVERVSLLRQTLSALDQAEAVPPGPDEVATDGPFAQSRPGVGTTEAPRRVLSAEDVDRVLRAEVTEALEASTRLSAIGRMAEAEQLAGRGRALQALLDASM
jgi:hypothetical protein